MINLLNRWNILAEEYYIFFYSLYILMLEKTQKVALSFIVFHLLFKRYTVFLKIIKNWVG